MHGGVPVVVDKGIGTARLAAVEFPLAIKPSTKGLDAALGFIGGKEELSRATADEVSLGEGYVDFEVLRLSCYVCKIFSSLACRGSSYLAPILS